MKILADDRAAPVTADHVGKAADHLMRRRGAHLDSLLAHLNEPRVRRVIEPMLALSALEPGVSEDGHSLADDLAYARELGLVKTDGGTRPANRFYASAITRYLNEDIVEALRAPAEDIWARRPWR